MARFSSGLGERDRGRMRGAAAGLGQEAVGLVGEGVDAAVQAVGGALVLHDAPDAFVMRRCSTLSLGCAAQEGADAPIAVGRRLSDEQTDLGELTPAMLQAVPPQISTAADDPWAPHPIPIFHHGDGRDLS